MSRQPRRGDKKLRYGFIGAGGIAGEHMTHLALRKDVELVAMADPDEASMARYTAKFGVGLAPPSRTSGSVPARRFRV